MAMAYPEPEKGGRGKLSRNRDGLEDKTFRNNVSLARAVLHHSAALAQEVAAGIKRWMFRPPFSATNVFSWPIPEEAERVQTLETRVSQTIAAG